MALISELLANIILLVTRPFSLLKLACLFGIRIALLVTYTWTELIRTIISFHVNIILRIITWTFGLISLPARAMNIFQKERQLEQKLHEMQIELEHLVWDKKELQEHFQMAVKERKMLEILLAELEEEHDMAIAKIEKLEGKLRDQKNKNLRLKELQAKGYWSSNDQNNADRVQNNDDSNYNISHPILSLNSNYNESGIALQDLLMRKDLWEDESKTRSELLKLLKTGPKSGLVKPEIISKDAEMSEALDHRRDVALSQSLFSAIMSLAVGVTAWEAEDPCMPLVVALFAVVGMSLKSVVQFFSTIRNKPASDAVALLSFNWFILGTLTYPTLPRVARMLAPLVLRIMDRTMSRFGLLSLA
ncbi:alkylated DNA repair protein alkB [Spatholobus suberectus]|nr:alkylated DNA repair protein alkB [Spatholobus suberectus]